MNTILAVVLISLYVLSPMATALAVAKSSSVGMVAGVIAIVIFSVSFWMTFEPYITANTTLFAFASLWQVFGGVGAVYMVADDLDLV